MTEDEIRADERERIAEAIERDYRTSSVTTGVLRGLARALRIVRTGTPNGT